MPVDWGVWTDRLVGVPLQILGILLAALLVRWLLHRLIRRVVAQASARHERRDTDRAAEAFAHLEGGDHVGKVVVRV